MSRPHPASQQLRVPRRTLRRRLHGRLSSVLASAYLHSCDRVGKRAEVRGRPFIENTGRIEIGDNFCLHSQPIPSHLVTGHKGHLEIGHEVSIGFGAAIASHGRVTIGSRVRIGPLAMIMDTDFHDLVARDLQPEAGMIMIGDDVQVGSRVTILRGSVIGAGASIMSGSVVTGHIPPGVRAGGVPARVLRADGEPARTSPAAAAGEITEDAVAERVRRVVATTFSLDHLPDPSHGPANIGAWDSLGTYRLLVDLEDEFRVSLTEEEMVEVKNVQDICRMMLRALVRDPATAESLGTAV